MFHKFSGFKLLHTNPHILANQKSPIPVTANPFDLLANEVLSDGMSCVMKSTSSTSKVSNKSDTTQVSPISFTLPADAEESHQISPLPSPLQFHESSEVLYDPDMLTLHDLPVESGSMSIDMNESSFSLSDLNVSVHQDITLTPPTDEEFLEFFMKLKGAHKQVEKCADFKLDFRYLIRRLIKLDSQNLIERADKPRLKSLVKKLAMHIDLKLPIMNSWMFTRIVMLSYFIKTYILIDCSLHIFLFLIISVSHGPTFYSYTKYTRKSKFTENVSNN